MTGTGAAGQQVGIEALGEGVLKLYDASGMDRGRLGREAIEWTFGSNPTPFCTMRLDGEIVGLSAYIGARCKFGSRVGYAQQAVDSFVSERVRGKGVFTRLAEAYAEQASATGTDLIWGFPNANAAPIWFGRLGWSNQGQVPLLVRPLRAGFLLRKLRIPFDFPLSYERDRDFQPVDDLGAWADALWARFSDGIGCAVVRDRDQLVHRLFRGPRAGGYRVVAAEAGDGALVATAEAEKHGGRIGYLMEAMGGRALKAMLASELARLRDRGTELVLAWCFPWSPNYRTLRSCGFVPVPERFRPIRIWFGGRALSPRGRIGEERRNWYLSYLDSDTV